MDLIKKHIAYADPHIRPIIDQLRSKILQLNGRIVEGATPQQRITYSEQRIFAEVKVQKKLVVVRIFDTGDTDPSGMLQHIEYAAKQGWQHDKELRLDNMLMLDDAMRFVEASLHFSRNVLPGYSARAKHLVRYSPPSTPRRS
ncbi:hypothetical protein NKJ71_25570 [Mesorhizobium sp. M0050]|uniref:DUF5655 domain-containing protein n=1 Tax=Mesorhizobium sp. M0050 TaxID=2956861 RepID=UPI00333B498B